MKTFLNHIGSRASHFVLAIAITLAGITTVGVNSVGAAVANYGPGVGVYALPIHMGGVYNYAATLIPVRFKLPYAGRLIGFSASARALNGAATVDFLAGGVSLLSAPVSLSAGAVTEATIATSAVADEAELTVKIIMADTVAGTATDITVMPTFLRR